MAKFTYGPIVSDARNKVAGVVFSRSRSGPYGRTKVSPTQPRTSYQRTVRSFFSALSKLWGDATMDANRAGWRSLAERYPVKDVFGNSRTLTGLQMFVKCNRALQAVGETVLLVAPASLIANTPGVITATAVAGAGTIAITVATNPSLLEVPVIFAAGPVSRGKNTIGGALRQIMHPNPGVAGPYAAGASYVTKFGSWAVGQRLFFEVFYTRYDSGAQGGKSAVNCIST